MSRRGANEKDHRRPQSAMAHKAGAAIRLLSDGRRRLVSKRSQHAKARKEKVDGVRWVAMGRPAPCTKRKLGISTHG